MNEPHSQPATPDAAEGITEEVPVTAILDNPQPRAANPPGTSDGSDCWCQQLLEPVWSCSSFDRGKSFAEHVCGNCKAAKDLLLPMSRVRLVGRDEGINNEGKASGLWKVVGGVEFLVVNLIPPRSQDKEANAHAKPALIVVFKEEEHATRETCAALFPQATQLDIPGDWLLDSTRTSLVVSVNFNTLVPVCPCHAPPCRDRA